MATETDTTPSGWNVNTLKEYFSTLHNDLRQAQAELRQADDLRYQQRFDAQQKAVADALSAAEKAVNSALLSADRAVAKAETAAEKRFESVNEFRAVLTSQSATLLPRSEANAQFNAIAEKIEDLKARIDRGDGKSKGEENQRGIAHANTNIGIGVIAGIVGALSLIALVVFSILSMLHTPVANVLTPAVVDNTKQVDDLITRLDAMQRTGQLQPATQH